MSNQQICYNCFSGTNGIDPCPYCGFDNSSVEKKQHLLMPGTILHEGYLIGRPLGQGGFGITYLGYDLASHSRVAIKEYFPAGIAVRQNGVVQAASDENQAIFKKGVETFNKEAQILSHLGNQPNIVNILAFFFENGTGYFVMEFLEGRSLKDYLNSRGGKLSFPETVSLLLPVMKALSAVHHEGMLHRDIAPDNIYVTNDGQVKLMDFGAARYHTFLETQSIRTVVKPGYAPMEQYTSQSAQGPWTDVYAMGATIYRTLTGIVPPDAPSRYMKDEIKSPLQLGCILPNNADYAIMRALSPQIVFRFRTMDDFARALTMPDPVVPLQSMPLNPIKPNQSVQTPPYSEMNSSDSDENATRMIQINFKQSKSEKKDIPYWLFFVLIFFLVGLIIWFIISLSNI